MALAILLNTQEAAQVRYRTTGVGGLNPIERADGGFFLGLECLDDPEHGEFLATLPVGDPGQAKWELNAPFSQAVAGKAAK